MRKPIATVILSLCLLLGAGSARAVNLDITNANMEITESNIITLHNCQVGSSFYYVNFQWHPTLNAWIPTGYGPEYSTFSIEDYVPSEIGNTWTYQISGGGLKTDTIAGFDEICGIACTRVEGSSGEITWWAADEPGGQLVRMQDASGSYVTYCPPVQISNAHLYLGFSKLTPFEDVPYTNPEGFQTGSFDGYFSYTGRVRETVETPAGIFPDCVRIGLIVSRTETWGGIADLHVIESWHAERVGVVKRIGSYVQTFDGALLYSSASAEILQSATVGGVTYP